MFLHLDKAGEPFCLNANGRRVWGNGAGALCLDDLPGLSNASV
jgi:hypothetical protein